VKIDDAAPPTHACTSGVFVPFTDPEFAQTFAHAVVWVAVHAAHTDDAATVCDYHPSHLPPPAADEIAAVLDVTLMRGGKRRDQVCGRCLLTALWAADRDGPVVCWLIVPGAPVAAPGPLDALVLGTWPPVAVTA
jgi:hypothetical protein